MLHSLCGRREASSHHTGLSDVQKEFFFGKHELNVTSLSALISNNHISDFNKGMKFFL